MDDNLTEMKTIDSDDKRTYTLSKEAPVKAVVKLGVPLIAGMMIMVLYNLVDTYFIGLLRDDYQLAAVNLAYPVMMILVAISNMIGTGASSLIARSLGAEDIRKVNNNLAVAYGELTVAAMGIARIRFWYYPGPPALSLCAPSVCIRQVFRLLWDDMGPACDRDHHDDSFFKFTVS